MSVCRSTFDTLGPNPRPTDLRGTHTCELDVGHVPPHVCPRCGARWINKHVHRLSNFGGPEETCLDCDAWVVTTRPEEAS